MKILIRMILITAGFVTLYKLLEKKYDYQKLLNQSKNLNAFLQTIQYAEGTYGQRNPYAITYGYSHTIRNFSDHPAITGEWKGRGLPASYCSGAKLSAACYSSAAGAYQFTKPTWEGIKRALTKLSFNKKSQDIAATHLLHKKGALAHVLAGRFEQAINKSNTTWASLPGSPYGQPTQSMTLLMNFYESRGGEHTTA